MADKVKYGIIGTSAIAAMHAEALQNSKNAELVAVFDQVTERAKSAEIGMSLKNLKTNIIQTVK